MSTLLDDKVDEETTVTTTENGDHDRFSHFFKKEDVDNAIFTGQPAKALCGKKDIPVRPTSEFPLCDTCKSIYEKMKG